MRRMRSASFTSAVPSESGGMRCTTSLTTHFAKASTSLVSNQPIVITPVRGIAACGRSVHSPPAWSPTVDPNKLLAVVAEVAREAHPHFAAEVALDSSLERDLGLDSLARVELVLRLEREFGSTLAEQALAAPRRRAICCASSSPAPGSRRAPPIARWRACRSARACVRPPRRRRWSRRSPGTSSASPSG
jgi:acyl carrier protein